MSFGIKKKDGQIIGTIDGDTIDHRNRNLMIGVAIYDPSERGKGYATEACKSLIQWVFHNAKIKTLTAIVKPENIASKITIEKLGFQCVNSKIIAYNKDE